MNCIIIYRNNPGIKVDESEYRISVIKETDIGNIDEWSHESWTLHYNSDIIRKFFIEQNQYTTIPKDNNKYITLFCSTSGNIDTEIDYFEKFKSYPLLKKIFNDLKQNKTCMFYFQPDQNAVVNPNSDNNDNLINFLEKNNIDFDNFVMVSGNYILNKNEHKKHSKLNFINFNRTGVMQNVEKRKLLNSYQRIVKSTEGYLRQHKFLCPLNNIFKPHRFKLLMFLLENNLLNDGIFSIWPFILDQYETKEDSYHGMEYTFNQLLECVKNDGALTDDSPEIKDLRQKEHYLDKIFDLIPMSMDWKRNGTHQYSNFSLYMNSYFHIVGETEWDLRNHPEVEFGFLSEKIFKPMLGIQPFIVVGHHGSLDMLKKWGFKTFDRWIDESYDKEENLLKRMELLEKEILRLSKFSREEMDKMYWEMYDDVLIHNFNQIDIHVVDEWNKVQMSIENMWENINS